MDNFSCTVTWQIITRASDGWLYQQPVLLTRGAPIICW